MNICDYCDWNSLLHDEIGAIDYCTRRDIYSDKMEYIKECYYFQDKEKSSFVYNTTKRKYLKGSDNL